MKEILVYIVCAEDLGDHSIIVMDAHRSWSTAAAERDALNEKWAGKFRHFINISTLKK